MHLLLMEKLEELLVTKKKTNKSNINQFKRGVFYSSFFLYIIEMNRTNSLDDFIKYLENRIDNEDFRNSVEKITFLTTLHVIKKNIGENE